MRRKRKPRLTALEPSQPWLLSILFFVIVCLCAPSTAKSVGLGLIIVLIISIIAHFSILRDRITAPIFALFLLVLMDGISTLYAVSGKFALSEFLKVQSAFCLSLLLLLWTPGKGDKPGRQIATVLECFAALAGIFSIDLLSTRLLSSGLLAFLGLLNSDYQGLPGVEVGVRMTSIFQNPNIFAGCMGIGVLMSLGLTLSCDERRERFVHLFMLFVNSLAFVLAFSMGASGAIIVAFLAYLALEQTARRAGLLVLMLETLVLSVIASAIISITSFHAWNGFQPIPLLYVPVGAALLCALDSFFGRKVAEKLAGHGKMVIALIGGVLVVLVVFAFTAYHMTGDITLHGGDRLRRAAYPETGTYILNVEADASLTVTIQSQDQQETMMHTHTLLYSGEASGASFTVPEDSLVVYFNFQAKGDTHILSVSYTGERGTGTVPLGYKLLPSFIANRLQGLFANENAIQRTVFFADGIKLFRRSPVFGLGLGAFENGIKSVQSFYYETKYAHNHYIQSLVETGVVGLLLFVGLLAVSAAAVWFARQRGDFPPMLPPLGAALVFMAGHAATEVVFSAYCYLPMAFGVFGLIGLCCGDAVPRVRFSKACQNGTIVGICVSFMAFGALLIGNISAKRLVDNEVSLDSLSQAIRLDKYEWADYMLTYVVNTTDSDVSRSIRNQADEYVQQLSEVDSNVIPIYLADYYFQTGRSEDGIAMLEKYVSYVASDPSAWQATFDILQWYEEDTDNYREGVKRIAGMLEERNAQNMEDISVDEEAQAFIARVSA